MGLLRENPARLRVIASCLLLAVLVVLVMTTVYFINQDRAALVSRFAESRLKQIAEAGREIGDDLDGVIQDLHFAGRLVQTSDTAANRYRILEALLGSVKPYRAATFYSFDDKDSLTVTDPRARFEISPLLLTAMYQTAQKAKVARGTHVETSFPIKDAELSWYRVFAIPLVPKDSSRPPDVLAILIDTEPFLEKLHLVAADPQSQLLILGPHGRCAPMSDPRLCGAMEKSPLSATPSKTFSFLVKEMLSGTQGTLVIDKHEATAFGFDPVDVVAAYTPIPIQNSTPWSIGMLTTTATLRAVEQKMMWRMGLVACGIALALIAFGSYIVISSRRAAVLQERLLHADELAHIHEKSEKILETIPTGIMALSETGRITTLNRALQSRVSSVALGHHFASAFPAASAETLSRLEALIARVHVERSSTSLLGESLALFNEAGQYNLHVVPLERPIQEVDVLVVLEDVTEVKTLASQLLRSEKLATVGILAAGVAHEIGTPLGVVRGRAEHVLEKLGSDHKESSGLRVIIEQIDRIASTIRELLDFSRSKSVNVSGVALAPMVHKVIELLRYEISRRNLKVSLEISDSLPMLAADIDQLQQVMINLAMNACDACSDGEEIWIGARLEHITTSSRYLCIEVVDTGCGIPTEHLLRVFDPFFTTKKRGQGTGLGLTIVSQIVRNHGGEIELKSDVGEGTRVRLRWPIVESLQGERHAS